MSGPSCPYKHITDFPSTLRRTLEAAGVLQAPAGGWKIDDFVETSVATLA